MKLTNERSNSSLGFNFEEEPSDLNDDEFSAPPMPVIGGARGVLGYYPEGHMIARYPHMTRPPGVPNGLPIFAAQTTQKWKTYRLLAHCFITRDYVISGPTDMIGGIHPGNLVVAHDARGYRIKVRIPTFGWYGTHQYQGEEFGWMDVRSPTGELLVVEMQPQVPTLTPQGHGTVIVPPHEEVVYPTLRVMQPLPIPSPTPSNSPLPVITGYEAVERSPQTSNVLPPKHNAYQTAVYQPSTPKDLPNVYPQVILAPSPKNTAATPKATHVSSGVSLAKASPESAGGKKPSPLLRKPLAPVPMVPPKAVSNTSAPSDKKVKRTAAVQGTDGPPSPARHRNRHGNRSRRRGMYRDKHQALVSHTPGVILYPRDPVTGIVIIPKHLVAAHRKNRRPPCRRRAPNSWKKQHKNKA